MNTILIDTSVWVNFLKGISTTATEFLRKNGDTFIIATCPVIMQEVLQGVVSDKQFAELTHYFKGFTQLNGDPYLLAQNAAQLYRELRKSGVTIRKPNDCLIASYALKHNLSILHDDRDFTQIAKYSSLITIN